MAPAAPPDLRPPAAVAALAAAPPLPTARQQQQQQQQQQAAAAAPSPGPSLAGPAGALVDSLRSVDTRDDLTRNAAYAGRIGQLVRVAERVSSVRHLAYASDVGEAFRPAWPRWAVNATYGVAVGYVAADVAVQTAGASAAGAPPGEVARVAAHTAAFQGLASVLLPFLAIHTAVHQSGRALRAGGAAPGGRLARLAPSALGLALIPFLPLADAPVERAVDAAFDAGWPDTEAGRGRAAERRAARAAAHGHGGHHHPKAQ